MPRSGPHPEFARSESRLRRAYFDCRYGQLHIHNAIPGGGGFDELTAVICLHDTGESGVVFLPLLAPLGAQRSVYALDLPGVGGTDPAPGVPDTEAAVNVVCDFLDNMRIRSVDLIARGGAAAAAQQLLETRDAALRKVVLVGATAAVRSGPKVVSLGAAEATPQCLITLLAPS